MRLADSLTLTRFTRERSTFLSHSHGNKTRQDAIFNFNENLYLSASLPVAAQRSRQQFCSRTVSVFSLGSLLFAASGSRVTVSACSSSAPRANYFALSLLRQRRLAISRITPLPLPTSPSANRLALSPPLRTVSASSSSGVSALYFGGRLAASPLYY